MPIRWISIFPISRFSGRNVNFCRNSLLSYSPFLYPAEWSGMTIYYRRRVRRSLPLSLGINFYPKIGDPEGRWIAVVLSIRSTCARQRHYMTRRLYMSFKDEIGSQVKYLSSLCWSPLNVAVISISYKSLAFLTYHYYSKYFPNDRKNISSAIRLWRSVRWDRRNRE